MPSAIDAGHGAAACSHARQKSASTARVRARCRVSNPVQEGLRICIPMPERANVPRSSTTRQGRTAANAARLRQVLNESGAQSPPMNRLARTRPARRAPVCTACHRQGSSEAWLGPITAVDVPRRTGQPDAANRAGGADLSAVVYELARTGSRMAGTRCDARSGRTVASVRLGPGTASHGGDAARTGSSTGPTFRRSCRPLPASGPRTGCSRSRATSTRTTCVSPSAAMAGGRWSTPHFAARRRHPDRTRLRFVAGRRRRSDHARSGSTAAHTRRTRSRFDNRNAGRRDDAAGRDARRVRTALAAD